ncbi:MAG: thermonuclease family protein [Pseudomonadota bacterium]
MKSMIFFALGALTVCLLYLFSPIDAPRPFDVDGPRATVSHIVDGDTLDLKGVERRIRIWGIDTPERGQNGFHTATEALRQLTQGQHLTLIPMEIGPDSYGRTVARLRRDDGLDIGEAMIEGGHAREFCRYSKGYYGTCGARP